MPAVVMKEGYKIYINHQKSVAQFHSKCTADILIQVLQFAES